MSKEEFNFDYISGDPFVEAGRRVIVKYADKKHVDISQMKKYIDSALGYYVDKWSGKINAISLNGTITQPAFKGKQKEETIKYFEEIFNDKDSKNGNCQTCGRQGSLFPVDRSIMPLSGSGTNPNFHPLFTKGIMVCHECLISLFFLPLAVMSIGKCLLMSATSDELFNLWLEETLDKTLNKLSSEGMTVSEYKLLHNELYRLAKKFADMDGGIITGECINFYYFTNFGASPECTLINIPAGLLLFLSGIKEEKKNIGDEFSGVAFSDTFSRHAKYHEEWNQFIWRHYVVKKDKEYFDKEQNEYFEKAKKEVKKIESNEVTQKFNIIIERLIKGLNILQYMRKDRLSCNLAKLYCEGVLGMEKERTKTIIQLADKISDLVKKLDKGDIITDFEKCRYGAKFRQALLKTMKRYAKAGMTEPLFTTDDYVDRIVPYGEPWTDVRDLLLIRMYEKLHEWMANKDINLDIETEEEDNGRKY